MYFRSGPKTNLHYIIRPYFPSIGQLLIIIQYFCPEWGENDLICTHAFGFRIARLKCFVLKMYPSISKIILLIFLVNITIKEGMFRFQKASIF
jgi:hypothetical protein